MDDLDWEQHCREFDAVARAHRDSPLPKRALADHHRIFMARLKADQAACSTALPEILRKHSRSSDVILVEEDDTIILRA